MNPTDRGKLLASKLMLEDGALARDLKAGASNPASGTRARIEQLRRENAQLQLERDAKQQETVRKQLEQLQLQNNPKHAGHSSTRQKLEELRQGNSQLRAQQQLAQAAASPPSFSPQPRPSPPRAQPCPSSSPSTPTPSHPCPRPSPPPFAGPCKFSRSCMNPMCSRTHPSARDQAVAACLHPYKLLRTGTFPSVSDTEHLAEGMHSRLVRLQSNQSARKHTRDQLREVADQADNLLQKPSNPGSVLVPMQSVTRRLAEAIAQDLLNAAGMSTEGTLDKLLQELPVVVSNTRSDPGLGDEFIGALHVLRMEGNKLHFSLGATTMDAADEYNILLTLMAMAVRCYQGMLQTLVQFKKSPR
ncbi:hypothetical protein DUNSADRAFT_5644 [Dunaliella salina]|uniref:Uncharacterized protein n=1 Tax=Dunaliella salina TaxID=3046 RepID=A0ABQ7GPX4_DUNSA|nr:hypothetical protein DUNSADRAFT_5644 [Dunaliella salina]|eukprot:KAF5836650.1 hypothetical protein DUNSADRAFT_5644 [Dunaliella salina]